jgi:hypothetical protein
MTPPNSHISAPVCNQGPGLVHMKLKGTPGCELCSPILPVLRVLEDVYRSYTSYRVVFDSGERRNREGEPKYWGPESANPPGGVGRLNKVMWWVE